MPKDSLLFHGLTALTLATFALGLVAAALAWAGGVRLSPGRLLRDALRHLAHPAVRRSAVLDVVLQRRLYRLDRVRWALHGAITWSFLELFLVGSLGLMFSDWGLYHLGKDERWFAATNDAGGVVLLVSTLLTLARSWLGGNGAAVRYRFVLAFLALMAASGFLLEATRLLDQGVPYRQAAFSFAGFTVSRVLAPLGANWHDVWLGVWWSHAVLGLTLVASVPFGSLLHLVTAPASLLWRAPAAEREAA